MGVCLCGKFWTAHAQRGAIISIFTFQNSKFRACGNIAINFSSLSIVKLNIVHIEYISSDFYEMNFLSKNSCICFMSRFLQFNCTMYIRSRLIRVKFDTKVNSILLSSNVVLTSLFTCNLIIWCLRKMLPNYVTF